MQVPLICWHWTLRRPPHENHACLLRSRIKSVDDQGLRLQTRGMTWFRLQKSLRAWVLVFYSLAVAVLGFAHSQSVLLRPTPDLAAFMLPDGSLPTICFDDGRSRGPAEARTSVCDACLLSSAPGLEACASESDVPVSAVVRLAFHPPSAAVIRHAQNHVPHLRGPPIA